MTVKKIEDNAKVNVFLTLIGPKSFELITNMCAPDYPTTKSHDDLVKLLSDYYLVPRNAITERMELRKYVQQPVSNTLLNWNLWVDIVNMVPTSRVIYVILLSLASVILTLNKIFEKSMQDVNWISRQVQGRESGGGGSWNGGGNRGGKKIHTQKKTVQQ